MKRLSKPTFRRVAPRIRCTSLFHVQFTNDRARTVRQHTHTYWHVDFLIAGQAVVESPRGQQSFGITQPVIIPAGTRHGFRYLTPGLRGWSLRFESEGYAPDDVEVLEPTLVVAGLVRLLTEWLPTQARRRSATQSVANHLLEALLASQLHPAPAERERSLEEQIEQFVHDRGGLPVSVDDAAEAVGYSASHLTTRLRREAQVSPKTLIDRTRARIASQRLHYSDESIGAIAQALGFPDIYSFSRFFKRLWGKSPSAFRASAGTAVPSASGGRQQAVE